MDSQEPEVEDQHFPSLLPAPVFFFSFVTAGLVLLTFCLLMQIGRYSTFSPFPPRPGAGSSLETVEFPFELLPELFSLIEICSIGLGSKAGELKRLIGWRQIQSLCAC